MGTVPQTTPTAHRLDYISDLLRSSPRKTASTNLLSEFHLRCSSSRSGSLISMPLPIAFWYPIPDHQTSHRPQHTSKNESQRARAEERGDDLFSSFGQLDGDYCNGGDAVVVESQRHSSTTRHSDYRPKRLQACVHARLYHNVVAYPHSDAPREKRVLSTREDPIWRHMYRAARPSYYAPRNPHSTAICPVHPPLLTPRHNLSAPPSSLQPLDIALLQETVPPPRLTDVQCFANAHL